MSVHKAQALIHSGRERREDIRKKKWGDGGSLSLPSLPPVWHSGSEKSSWEELLSWHRAQDTH
jgi:hypothetical protein